MENRPVKIAHISDSHILPQAELELYNVNTYKTLEYNLKKIDGMNYDFILFTGDLSQNGELESYILLNNLFEQCKTPIHCIPGNHDSLENMNQIFSDRNALLYTNPINFLNWELIFVDTVIPGKDHGHIQNKAIEALKNSLEVSNATNISIVMHHHPIPVDTPLIDNYIIDNGNELIEVIESNPRVKSVIFGHVHNDYLIQRNDISYISAPATSFQFKQGAVDMVTEKKNGYKEYIFSANDFHANCFWSK